MPKELKVCEKLDNKHKIQLFGGAVEVEDGGW